MLNRPFFRRLGCAMQVLSVAGLVVFLADDAPSRWQGARMLAAIAVGAFVVIRGSLLLYNRRRKPSDEMTDYTHAFDTPQQQAEDAPDDGPYGEPVLHEGEIVAPDVAVHEATEIGERLTAAGVRFALEQAVVDSGYHGRFGGGGLYTRMRVIVHPDDVAHARPIVDKVLKIMP